MTSNTTLFFRVGVAFFASALAKMGIDGLRSPQNAAKGFALPASSAETLAYQPVWGARDLGFGSSILGLLAADLAGVITPGDKAAALVTAAGACVGLGDSLLVRSAGGQGAGAHAIGASGMLAMALGLWMSSQ